MRHTTIIGLTLGALLLTPAVASAEWKGFTLSGEDGERSYALTLQGRLQTRFEWVAVDGGDNEARFSVPRARLTLKGHMLEKELTYKFQADFGKGTASLKDFYVNYAFSDGFQLRLGQWKRPFSRQQITSSGDQELVDRALTDKAFGAGRDIGLMIHNNYEKSPELEWAFGVFNGTGDAASFKGTVVVDPATGEGSVTKGAFSNVPGQFQPALALRLGWNTGDTKGEGYSEADFNGDKGVRFGLGASALYDLGYNDSATELKAELDYFLKVSGLSTTGGFYLATALGDGGLETLGFHVQAGYMVAGMVEPVIRVGRIMPDAATSPDLGEYTVGANVFFDEHAWKWTTDISMLTTELGSTTSTNWMIRTQVQAAF